MVIDASALGTAASHVRDAANALTWDFSDLAAGTLGDDEVADAVAHVVQQRKARVEVLGETADVAAGYPIQVTGAFANLDQGLARGVQ